VALPVKALKAGQEAYWLDQIARNREEYFSGRGESPGRFVGTAAVESGLEGIATAEQVRAMFQGLDPATGEVRCAPLWRADPRSKLAAGPLLDALRIRATERGVEGVEQLARSKALKGDVRSVQAACRQGGAKRIKVETVERLCRKVLDTDPRELYGEGFERAWQHRGKRVNERVQAFDHCFSSPKSVSLLAAGGGPRVRRLLAEGRDEALQVSIRYLERHGIGVRRDRNGTDRYRAVGGLVAVAFEHRMSRAGDPNCHTHVLVQNAAQGPDGRWTALDSDRLYAHLMAADHLHLAAERAALTERLGVRWGPVDERSGAAEIIGLDDRTLIERFSKRSEQIDRWLAEQGLSGIKASSAAAVATRAPKDYSESEQSVYGRWAAELAALGVGERQLAEVCSGGRGRPATRTELDAVLEELAGPDGLTGQVSTFTRTDVVDALAKRLPVASSAQEALTQVQDAADPDGPLGQEPLGRVLHLGMDRYSTPELLALERHFVDNATQRADERCAVVQPELVRQVLDRHQTAGEDQAAMVRDLAQGGEGVALVAGRAGSGKTWALGVAREAFELAGYQVLGCAPTGIATVGLADEGFSEARTVDRLLLDLAKGRTKLDDKAVLVVDEAAMVPTRKLAPLLEHAHRAGAKVVLVGDDRQFASIQAGGGFRALRLRLGASELTVNRRQVEAWEQRAIDDIRAGRIEQAIAAYAEHDRIQAFEARDDRDRALVNDWWRAHEAGEQPVVYAHRRVQVDQLNSVCQRLRVQVGQLGAERLAVGDLVVLGANARDRLGVVNGTTAVIQELDVPGRAMTVRTLEEVPPRTVRLPRWYLDAAVRPGQSRRVDLAYARTDMRSQGRTERRALLAIDGAEDMQGGYVQLTRSTDRTDLYLTVGPEPLGPDEERPHPSRASKAPEELLARVLSRDGSKTLASDTPDLPDVRRLSTRELRAERDRLAALRAACPPDRSRELRLAAQRAAEAEQARQQARKDRQQAAEEVAALQGRLLRRRDVQAARERLVLAEHAVRTTTGQADQAAERLGILRRAQQRHLGWMEAHDAELRVRERALGRELGWRGRVDQRALVLDPPGWLLDEFGPVPADPRERAVWRVAAAELDGYQRAYGLDHDRPAKHVGGRVARDGRAAAPARIPTPRSGPAGPVSGGSAAAVASAPIAEATSGDGRPWPTVTTGPTRSGCWAPNPDATPPAAGATGRPPGLRWRTWPAGAATATSGLRTANDPAAPLAASSASRNAAAASWQKGAPHAPAARPRRLPRRGPRPAPRRQGRGPRGAGHAGLPGHRPVGPRPDRRGAPAVPRRPPRPARPAAGQRLDRPEPTGAPLRGSPDPTEGWP
jgi:conjugative relaxase-like TrwC/TraI family protein